MDQNAGQKISRYAALSGNRGFVALCRRIKAMPADLKKITTTATRTPSWFLKTFYRNCGKADKQCVQSDITALFITAAKRRVTGCFYFFRLGAFFCRLAALTRLGARTENASTARHCSRIPYDNVPEFSRGDCFLLLAPGHSRADFLSIKQTEARFAERTARILARGIAFAACFRLG